MGAATPSVYLDTCLVIYLVEQHSAFYDPVQRAIEEAPDALHLATALHHGCDQLWTNDNRLARASGGTAVNVVNR